LELEPGTSVSEVRATKALVGKTLAELQLRERYGLSVLLIKGQRIIPAPSAHERISEQDVLVVIGPDDSVAKLEAI
jgi:trk system potassium uptake protein TrkA